MPRLSTEVSTDVTTTAEVKLSPKLTTELKKKLETYAALAAKKKILSEHMDATKEELELLFAKSRQYAALEQGTKIETSLGRVTMKIIKGVRRSLNKKKLMTKFKLTPADLDSVTDTSDNKPYLGIYLPGDEGDDQ